MKVDILKECGYEEAVKGIGLSYGIDDFERLELVAKKLCNKDGGHNKFLESIMVWIDIEAPRYWWQEFDTYRVGTSKQSESTIHTICRTKLSKDSFEDDTVFNDIIDYLNLCINSYNSTTNKDSKALLFRKIKNNLPEGYLQRRIVCTNYKTLRNMIYQRRNHVLSEWKQFLHTLEEQLERYELLGIGD